MSRPSALPFVVTSGDFDAPGRTQFVPRALAWVAPLVARLSRAGVDVEAAPLPAADTHAMVLWRAGLGPRAAIVLEIGASAIEAALELPVAAPELDVFRHQLQRAASAERIFGALAHLPEPFVIALHNEEPLPLSAIDVTSLQELLRRAVDDGKRLRIGWHLAREVALSLPPDDVTLADQLEGALAALAVPFALLLRDDAKPPRARAPSFSSLFRASLPARRAVKSTRVTKGARVRINSGPFEGKEAVVADVDGKGARVRLGLLATRFALADLDVLEPGRSASPRRTSDKTSAAKRVARPRRPALGSSHRKR